MKYFFSSFIFGFLSLFIFSKLFHSKELTSRFPAAKQASLADLNFDRSFINFPMEFPYHGLIHKPGHEGEYMQRLFGKILQSAHKLAHEDWLDVESGYYLTYTNFLLLSLQVPMHESNLMHFTIRDPKEYCVFANNVISPLKPEDHVLEVEQKILDQKFEEAIKIETKRSEDYPSAESYFDKFCRKERIGGVYPNLNKEDAAICSRMRISSIRIENVKYLNRGMARFIRTVNPDLVIKNCSELEEYPEVKQFQFANDYADVGIFMFNTTSHPEIFQSKTIFDFDEIVFEGLKYLYKGYDVVANHNLIKNKPKGYEFHDSLSCFDGLDAKTFEGRMFLMRGAWGGNYNSGKINKSCRIDRSHSTFKNARSDKKIGYKQNDDGFLFNMARFFYHYRDTEKFQVKKETQDIDGIKKEVEVSGLFVDIIKKKKAAGHRFSESLFHKYLPEDSLEKMALKELVKNVLYKQKNFTYINQVLATNYDTDSEINITESYESQNEKYKSILEEERAEKEAELQRIAEEKRIAEEQRLAEEAKVLEAEKQKLAKIAEENKLTPNTSNNISQELEEDKILGLPDIYIPPVEALPLIDERLFTSIITANDINIRDTADFPFKHICANTRISSVLPIKVRVTGEEGEFYRFVPFEPFSEFRKESCADLNEFYVHKDYVKKVVDYKIISLGKIVKPISLRKTAASKGVLIDYAFPSNELYVIIGENRKGSQGNYIWYQVLLPSGEKGWFYAGKQGQELKVELL